MLDFIKKIRIKSQSEWILRHVLVRNGDFFFFRYRYGFIANNIKLKFISGQFDVQNEMIIRTEESRQIGGKFLDSTDGGSREECLRFCCETNQCDVFVYDECNVQNEPCSRTCFLFHCGPAQNFRCKFSKHANYTSAVLTKKVIASTQPIRAALSQHEMELKNLKIKLVNANESPNGVAVDVNAITTTTIKRKLYNRFENILLIGDFDNLIARPFPAAVMPAKNSTNVCGRFQFQCHSGECIAVYNACDSIPQCEDGSDEGPEVIDSFSSDFSISLNSLFIDSCVCSIL